MTFLLSLRRDFPIYLEDAERFLLFHLWVLKYWDPAELFWFIFYNRSVRDTVENQTQMERTYCVTPRKNIYIEEVKTPLIRTRVQLAFIHTHARV